MVQLISFEQLVRAVKEQLNKEEVDPQKLSNVIQAINEILINPFKYLKRNRVTDGVSLEMTLPFSLTVTEKETLRKAFHEAGYDYKYIYIDIDKWAINWFSKLDNNQKRKLLPMNVVFIKIHLFYQ